MRRSVRAAILPIIIIIITTIIIIIIGTPNYWRTLLSCVAHCR